MARLRYFTPNEIVLHNKSDDLWVSLFGKVYNLTPLYEKHKGSCLFDPILAFAGKDISNWFHPKTLNPKTHVNPKTNSKTPFTPFGKFIDLSLEATDFQECNIEEHFSEATTDRPQNAHNIQEYNQEKTDEEITNETDRPKLPWWKDDSYVIGLVTSKPRKIHIVNMLLLKGVTIEVCCEENMDEILKRYLKFNTHAKSYTWRHRGKDLNMLGTLEENGIKDISEDLYRLKLNEDDFIPIIHLYYNDDLTVA
ncbi:cytochrome b5 domain-containing protein 1 [Centruroides vittatus]|uniref:cytochrome b5 domain-containing protein 1 n=1 Tax=Centruroides vittatus TaxID=120091 RepID=UPI003510217D